MMIFTQAGLQIAVNVVLPLTMIALALLIGLAVTTARQDRR